VKIKLIMNEMKNLCGFGFMNFKYYLTGIYYK
jgi:hypothetical protein